MAAYVRSVICLVSREQRAFLTSVSGVNVASKRYVRGLRRKPVKVVFPENDEAEAAVNKTRTQPRTAAAAAAAEEHVKREKKAKEARVTSAAGHPEESGSVKARSHLQAAGKQAHVFGAKDQVDGLRFERAFPGDKRLAKLVSVARSRTFREHQGKILLEGRRLICDALDAGASPQVVFFSMVDRLRELPLDKLKGATLVKVKFEEIKIWSELVAPQGVIAIFARPDPSRLRFANTGDSVPLSLICDNIRDPGNLGTMLRCAAAAGCHSVLLTKGCVDAWEPKVLRAAMGAHFRLPIYPNLDWEDVEKHLPKSATVHVADHTCDRSRGAEDLDVSASRRPSKAGDYGWVSTRHARSNARYEEYDSDSDGEGLSLPSVDARLYHESWAQSPAALVVGGETHGLSVEAVELAETTAGHRLFVPVVRGVDSLNSAMAASILLFEGRRQLLKLMQTSVSKLKSKAEGQLS